MISAAVLYVVSVCMAAARLAWPDFTGVPHSVRAWAEGAEQTARQSARSVTQPCRVFLVGSSPVLFGLSAVQIAEETGCTVLNAAQLNLRDTLAPYLTAVLTQVRRGDIVAYADRRWSSVPDAPIGCDEMAAAWCWVRSLRPLPTLANQWREAFRDTQPRGPSGDLMRFPTAEEGVGAALGGRLIDMKQRVARAVVVTTAITRAGAVPLLYGTPVLVRAAAQPALAADFATLDGMMTTQLGVGIWQGALLTSDAELFLSDARHMSAAGRTVWSGRVAHAVNALKPRLPSLQ